MHTELRIQPISAENFSAYGWVTDVADAGGRLINDGTSLRFDNIGELSLNAAGGEPCLALFKAKARAIQGPWHTLERHNLGTQTFVPLASARSVMLVALGARTPDRATLAAFRVPGNKAVTLRAGTWHHGLLAVDDGDFVVIERRAAETDCDLAQLDPPVGLILEPTL